MCNSQSLDTSTDYRFSEQFALLGKGQDAGMHLPVTLGHSEVGSDKVRLH